MGRWLLLIGVAVMLGFLVRELWRMGSAWYRARAAEREREAEEREQASRVAEREAAARRAPGGSPDNPIAVPAASVVEARAASEPCLRCGDDVRVDDHSAERHDDRRLRVARVECPRCGYRRERYFVIEDAEPVLH